MNNQNQYLFDFGLFFTFFLSQEKVPCIIVNTSIQGRWQALPIRLFGANSTMMDKPALYPIILCVTPHIYGVIL